MRNTFFGGFQGPTYEPPTLIRASLDLCSFRLGYILSWPQLVRGQQEKHDVPDVE